MTRSISVLQSNYTKIVHVKFPSLITNSTFIIPTEGINNKGHPHTLEHLVFLGSQQYPYKGILDLLANKSYANGTNAWTDVDHTAYTLDTVSWEGLHKLLPVYYDHILHPSMTESAYTTEIHHITPEFKDAGVVYCEMQARENSADDILQNAMMKSLYANSSYTYECGGLTRDIQTLSSEEIRQYHKKYYHPQRCLLIICGTYPEDKLQELLTMLDSVATSVSIDPLPERPWLNCTVNPIKSNLKTIEFPNEHEDVGNVSFSYLTDSFTDVLVNDSVSALLIYLSDSSASCLQSYFVETNSFCSDVYASMDYRKIPNYYIICQDVPLDKIEAIPEQFNKLIKNHQLDFERITLTLTRLKDQLVYDLENKPYDIYLDILIPNFLYLNPTELLSNTNPIEAIDNLLSQPKEHWTSIFNTYFVNRDTLVVIEKPSIALNQSIQQNKIKRHEELQSTYKGKSTELKQSLVDAIAYNERPVPQSIFEQFPFFDISISPYLIETARTPVEYAIENNSSQSYLSSLSKSKVFIQYDVYDSDFTTCQYWINTSHLSEANRNLLPVLTGLLFNCELYIDNKVVTLETVLNQLESDALEFHSSCGVHGEPFKSGYYGEYLVLGIRTMGQKSDKAVEWLFKSLHQLFLNKTRIDSVLQKLKKEQSNLKRDGSYCVEALFSFKNYKNSNKFSSSLFHQHHILSNLLHMDSNTLKTKLSGLVESLKTSEGFFHVQGPKEMINLTFSNLQHFSNSIPTNLETIACKSLLDFKSMDCVVYAPKSMESGYLNVALPVNVLEEDSVALSLTLEILEATEGPFWRKIRGAGLAYGTSLSKTIESHLLELYISECVDPFQAYTAAKTIVCEYINDPDLMTTEQFEGAKSSLIYSQTRQEKTMSHAANKCFQRTMLSKTSKHRLLNTIKQLPLITKDAVITILTLYISPLFSTKSNITLVLQPSKKEEQLLKFKSLGFNCKIEEFEFDFAEDSETEWDTATSMSE